MTNSNVPMETHEASVDGNVVTLKPTAAQTAWGSIRVAFIGPAVAVTGDAYDWIFSWGMRGGDVLPEVPRFGEHYILGKLSAASTRCPREHVDNARTLETFEQHGAGPERLGNIRAALQDACDVRHAQQLLMELPDAGSEDYDLVANEPSQQVMVAVRAVKMAAEAILNERAGSRGLRACPACGNDTGIHSDDCPVSDALLTIGDLLAAVREGDYSSHGDRGAIADASQAGVAFLSRWGPTGANGGRA